MKQIYIPFRERRHPIWPDGARIALAMYASVELWDGEGLVKYRHGPNLAPPPAPGMDRADLSITSTVEFGYRVGIYRLMDIWDEFGVRPALLSSGLAIETYTDIFKELTSKGHRIIGHGYEQSRYMVQMNADEQRAAMTRSIEVPQRVLGVKPNGWCSPGARQTEETLELVAETGYKFHVCLNNDELPYFIDFGGGRRIVEIPYRAVETGELNDYNLYSREQTLTWPQAVDYLKCGFDARYQAAKDKPSLVVFAVHPYVSGRADRALVVRQFLQHVKSFPDVWITDFDAIADWWIAQGPGL
jgi:allantoinase